eukprot:gene6869-6104_t
MAGGEEGGGELRARLEEAGAPAAPSVGQQQQALSLAAPPPSLAQRLARVLERRDAAGTAANAVLVEKPLVVLSGVNLLRRGLLSGDGAAWLRYANTCYALHRVAAAAPSAPAAVD